MKTRFAMEALQRLGKAYQDNAALQDALETLGFATATAAGQALFSDMTPEEIAISTLLGGGAAFAARPIAANLGGRIGQSLDRRYPGALHGVPPGMQAVYPGSGAQVRQLQQQVREATEPAEKQVAKALKNLSLSKYKQNMIRPDGTKRGDIEGFLTMIGRYQGDNAAQLAVALAAPAILGANRQETES